ncbi:MAG: helix-turn-helix domain-containing protein [Actinomycetota bacterium]
MARKKQPSVSAGDKAVIGALLRQARRAAGYRSAETAAAASDCPASRQTIYSYERGGLVPSLVQFLELVEFYVLGSSPSPASGRKLESDLRTLGVAAVSRALTLPAYHVAQAHDLIARMQPSLTREGAGRPTASRGQTGSKR